jgi:HNH endonuclease
MTVDVDQLPPRLRQSIKKAGGGCWVWTGSVRSTGYGQIRWSGKNVLTHRLVYQITQGSIPDGLVLDHLCREPLCCNPTHLEPVTDHENVVVRGTGPSAVNAVKTHCPSGHEYTPVNTWVGKKGQRHCRACHRNHQLAYMARKRARLASTKEMQSDGQR